MLDPASVQPVATGPVASATAEVVNIPIAIVERDTGIAKDTLRIWERRYGFPQPGRDGNGERTYSANDLEHLRAIKRLMDQGMRPGKLIGLPLSELEAMAQAMPVRSLTQDEQRTADSILELIRGHHASELRVLLQRLMLQQGLQAFVGQTIAHLNQHIGECWARGELTVAHEHLYTECVQTVLHGIIAAQPAGAASPRIVLTTVPGETHTLGLLMAEALWTAEGAACVSLGPQFPIADIPAVVQDGGYDIVALSFSLSFRSTHARNALRTLRSSLPPYVQIWAGGGALSQRHTIDGVRILGPIATASDALAEWRSQRG